MAELLRTPYLGSAEEDVLLVEWRVAEGESFRRGDLLFVVETLKANFEVEAESDGVLLKQLVEVGTRVEVAAPVGITGVEGEELDAAFVEEALAATPTNPVPSPDSAAASSAGALPATDPSNAPHAGAPGASRSSSAPSPVPAPRSDNASPSTGLASPPARRRARELGLELSSIPGTGPDGLIRLGDVEAAVPAANSPTAGLPTGRLDPTFLAHLRADPAAFARLASAFKLDLYRTHGALIGKDATLGPNSVLLTEHLVLGEGAHLGADVRVEAKHFFAGALLYLGPRTQVRATCVELGDNAYFAPDVEIGGGGAMDPEALLRVGSHGFVGEHVHLNPCRPLTLGDEVVVSRSAVVMTHSFGGSILRGYPNRFAPVTIGDGCQIGIGATLFPGVEMGAGSILLNGSSLVTSMPPGRLFGGVPATDLKAAAHPLTESELQDRTLTLLGEFASALSARGFEVASQADANALDLTVTSRSQTHLLRFRPTLSETLPPPAELTSATPPAETLLVCLHATDADLTSLSPAFTAIELTTPRIQCAGPQGPLTNALREFLRKRGVRLHPRTWTYPGGWL